jgi:hypothetical protein
VREVKVIIQAHWATLGCLDTCQTLPCMLSWVPCVVATVCLGLVLGSLCGAYRDDESAEMTSLLAAKQLPAAAAVTAATCCEPHQQTGYNCSVKARSSQRVVFARV